MIKYITSIIICLLAATIFSFFFKETNFLTHFAGVTACLALSKTCESKENKG